MFGFCHLPFSVSDTIFSNGEEFSFILSVDIYSPLSFNISREISFTLNIEQDRVITL
jgi:hypothetical protein